MGSPFTPATPLPDGKFLPVWFDTMASFTLTPGNALLPNSVGFLDANGAASSTLQIPAVPGAQGMTLYATATTLDQPRFAFVRTVFPEALSFTIQ